jgi:hypothetical protein
MTLKNTWTNSRKRTAASSLIVFVTIAVSMVSTPSSVSARTKRTTTKPAKKPAISQPRVLLGFNAKGSSETPNQVAVADTMLSSLPRLLVASMLIRVTGGTRSQTEVSADWSDSQLSSWIALQKRQGFLFVFVVNGNDTPENQLALIQRWQQFGAKFAFIEMMNEYYLSKYRNGDTSSPEVSRAVTPKQYFAEIVPQWFAVLDPLKIPYFVIGAPLKNGKSGAVLAAWNVELSAALRGGLATRHLGVTVHLYTDGSEPFDYTQIAKLRQTLPTGTRIAITEAGILNAADEQSMAAATKDHLTKILQTLKPGDALLDHVLYKAAGDGLEGTLSPSGLTIKGAAVIDVFTHAG